MQIQPCLDRRCAFVYSETCRVTGASCGPGGARERGKDWGAGMQGDTENLRADELRLVCGCIADVHQLKYPRSGDETIRNAPTQRPRRCLCREVLSLPSRGQGDKSVAAMRPHGDWAAFDIPTVVPNPGRVTSPEAAEGPVERT